MSKLSERLAEIRAEAKKIQDAADEAGRPKTTEEQAQFDALIAEAEQVKAAVEGQRVATAALAEMAAEDPDPTPAQPTVNGRRQSPGDIVVNSNAYKAMKAAYPNGAPDRTKPEMGSVSIGGFRNAVTTEPGMTPARHVVAPMSLSVIDIFSEINVVEGAPDAIKIFRLAFDNQAAVAAAGATKEESNLVITDETVNLEVIAHHTPIHKQTLWHNALLRNRIDNAMINGVRAKAQAEVASELLAAQASGLVQSQGFDTDLATTIRKAVTKAQRGILEIGGNPSIGVAISPEDHEQLDLELLDAMVALAGQELTQTARIWRATIVPLYGLTPGVAFVGDLKQVDFYVGQGISVTTGWVNEQFIKNQLTLLAEMEAKAAVIGGAALVATDLDAVAEPNFS